MRVIACTSWCSCPLTDVPHTSEFHPLKMPVSSVLKREVFILKFWVFFKQLNAKLVVSRENSAFIHSCDFCLVNKYH